MTHPEGHKFNQLNWDRYAFAKRWPIDKGAPTRVALFKSITDNMMPGQFPWHEWTYRMVEPLCDSDTLGNKSYTLVGVPGCSSSGKTYTICSFAVAWWLADPGNSSVTLISTSKQSLRRRGWAEVSRLYTNIKWDGQKFRYGNFVDSRMLWQSRKGDDKHAIIGKAVEEGPINKVADDIKGVHTRRQMVIIDEATSVPPAIYEACSNLYSYPEEFILILIGNPLNRLDQFGRFCEPVDGWGAVTVDTGEWEAVPQKEIAGIKPRVITFDAEKSPNILKGTLVSRHLPTKEDVEAAKKNSGGGQSPRYWQNCRGFWPPEGLSKTIFSESALIKNNAFTGHQFTGRSFLILGAFDPAFGGGDRPALRFAKMGEIEGGKIGVEWLPPKDLPIVASSSNPIHFQLAEQLRRECESFTWNGVKYSCEPENLGIDATGEGGGLCDIIQRTWSPKIIRVEFGGRPSEDSCNFEDIRMACDVYDKKVTEMWFRTRDMLNSGQLRGVDRETAPELCNREFDDSAKRIKLMSKIEYKLKFGKSPDYADTGVIISEVARMRGFKLAAIGETVIRLETRTEQVKSASAVYESESFQEEEEMDEAEALV